MVQSIFFSHLQSGESGNHGKWPISAIKQVDSLFSSFVIGERCDISDIAVGSTVLMRKLKPLAILIFAISVLTTGADIFNYSKDALEKIGLKKV